MRIWHAGAALNAGLTACGNATGPKDIFGSSAVPRFSIPPARLQRAHTRSVWVSFDQGSHGHRPVTPHSAGMHVGARICNAHARLPESALRAHCRRHCPGRWITANHPVCHPLGSQGQENVPTECGGGDTSVRFLFFHSVHRMHAFLAPTAQTTLGGNRCRATKSDF